MKQITTQAIILNRVDFQEADRILTLLTKDQGKIRVIAKGVRKLKSKLAGGLELLSRSDITYILGRSDIYTLVSTRLDVHYGEIVKDIDRAMLAYNFMKRINKLSEDSVGEEFFVLLNNALSGLNDKQLNTDLLEIWFDLQLLQITGHSPNLKTDVAGNSLDQDKKYSLDSEDMAFTEAPRGFYHKDHIKLMRVVSRTDNPLKLINLKKVDICRPEVLKLTRIMINRHIKI